MRRVGTDARPDAESATSGFVWHGRSIRSCVFASFPLGAGGARPRVDGAPRPPGSVRSGRTPGASAKTDPLSGWPACPVPGFARLDLLERRYSWLRRAVGSRSRIWNPGSSGGWSGPCARPPRAPAGSCASSGLIGKDLALWEEGQEALMSQGGPSVRQVGVSGSSSSVRARSPTRDAYVSMDPGGTVVFRAWLVPGVRRHG